AATRVAATREITPLSRAGFTLMEMLMVVAIIVALAGVGVIAILPQLNRSKAQIARTKIDSLMQVVESFEIANNRKPQSLEELLQTANGGPWVKSRDALKDPWDREFQYSPNDVNPETGAQSAKIWTTNPTDNQEISNFRHK